MIDDTSLRDEFEKLAEEWKSETAYISNIQSIVDHPAYRKIVAMGPEVIPLILEDLEKANNHWYSALYDLTGAKPVPKDYAGRMDVMREFWLSWGRKEYAT